MNIKHIIIYCFILQQVYIYYTHFIHFLNQLFFLKIQLINRKIPSKRLNLDQTFYDCFVEKICIYLFIHLYLLILIFVFNQEILFTFYLINMNKLLPRRFLDKSVMSLFNFTFINLIILYEYTIYVEVLYFSRQVITLRRLLLYARF